MAVSMAVSPNFSNFKLLICPAVAYRVRMLPSLFIIRRQSRVQGQTDEMEGHGKKKHAGVLGFFFVDDHDTGGECCSRSGTRIRQKEVKSGIKVMRETAREVQRVSSRPTD